MKIPDYFHVANQRDYGFTLAAKWLDKYHDRHFCGVCGSRLHPGKAINIQITKQVIPEGFLLGSFGQWDIGFAHQKLLSAFGIQLNERFALGNVVGSSGRPIANWKTFSCYGNQIPIRGDCPLLADACSECGRIRFSAPAKNGYIVSRTPLTSPLYESNEAQFLVREEILERVRPLLTRYVSVQRIEFRDKPADGREEAQLVWNGE